MKNIHLFFLFTQIYLQTRALLIYRRSDTRIPGTGAYQWELAQILDRHTPGLQGLTLQTSPSTNGAFFGFRHAADVENDWLLVAAPFQTVLDPLTNAPILDAGAVFAFCLNRLTGHWELSQMITNPESVSLGMFGGNLSISNGHAFISDTGLGSFPQINPPAATRNGTVYAFRLSERRRLWRYTQKLSGDESLALAQQLEFGDGFGASLSIDGRWAVIGAPFESFSAALEAQFQGSAYFFRLFDGKWIRTQKVVSDDFTTPFKQTSYFTAEIKGRVAIVSDAHRSGPAGEEQGGILVYYRKRGIWHPYPTIFDPNGAPFQNFGASSSLSDIQFVNGRFRIFFSGATSLFFFVPFQPSFVSVFEGVCQ